MKSSISDRIEKEIRRLLEENTEVRKEELSDAFHASKPLVSYVFAFEVRENPQSWLYPRGVLRLEYGKEQEEP